MTYDTLLLCQSIAMGLCTTVLPLILLFSDHLFNEDFERPGKEDRRRRLDRKKRRDSHELKILFGRRSPAY